MLQFCKSLEPERNSENKYDLGIKIKKPAVPLSPDDNQAMGMLKVNVYNL